MLTIEGRSRLPMPSLASDYNNYSGVGATKQIRAVHARDRSQHRHMWIITGPAGCGKSSIAGYLAKELAIPYLEGDDFHSASNREKMTRGIPLTDVDRWDWLISLREAAVAHLSPSLTSATKPHTGVVVTCSALRSRYRDVMRIAAYKDHKVAVHFIYLRADESVLTRRVQARKGHYMKSTMVHSQMELLEEPDGAEQTLDVLEVDCSASLAEVQAQVVAKARGALADDF